MSLVKLLKQSLLYCLTIIKGKHFQGKIRKVALTKIHCFNVFLL